MEAPMRTPTMSAALSVGGSDAILGHSIGYLFSGSYSLGTDLKDNQLRALADTRGDCTVTDITDQARP